MPNFLNIFCMKCPSISLKTNKNKINKKILEAVNSSFIVFVAFVLHWCLKEETFLHKKNYIKKKGDNLET